MMAQSNNLISGLDLEAPGAQLPYFRADRIVAADMSVPNGPISNLASHYLLHQAATKVYVDNRFIAYTTTERMNVQFEDLYARKSDLQTTDQRMLKLPRNISPSTIPDPFAFLEYNITFLLRPTLVLPFNKTIAYHVDPIAS